VTEFVQGSGTPHVHERCSVAMVVSLDVAGHGDGRRLATHVVGELLKQAVEDRVVPTGLLTIHVGPAELVQDAVREVSAHALGPVDPGDPELDQMDAAVRDNPGRLAAVAYAHCQHVDSLPDGVREQFR